jgi:hypothetical protein
MITRGACHTAALSTPSGTTALGEPLGVAPKLSDALPLREVLGVALGETPAGSGDTVGDAVRDALGSTLVLALLDTPGRADAST